MPAITADAPATRPDRPSPPFDSAGAPAPGAAAILEVIEWLAGDDCNELDDAGLVAGLGRRLHALGLPLDRLGLHLRTLHPDIIGRTIAWAPGEPVEIHDREQAGEPQARFIGSPLHRVMESREALTVRLDAIQRENWVHRGVFSSRGLAEIVIIPLCNPDGPVSVASFATRRRGGFGAGARAAIDRVLPALRNACELRTLRKVELTLLDTHGGVATAGRILAGRIRGGEVESLSAALMLCDFRGFTALSNRLPGRRALALLDAYFDQVLAAITTAGGAMIKIMGDAVLAFFPHDDARAACAAALAAARDIRHRLQRPGATDAVPQADIALHHGELSYGLSGSGISGFGISGLGAGPARRPDLTLLGRDFALLGRIGAACGRSGRDLLMSPRFADLLASPAVRPIGRLDLADWPDPVELHALADTASP